MAVNSKIIRKIKDKWNAYCMQKAFIMDANKFNDSIGKSTAKVKDGIKKKVIVTIILITSFILCTKLELFNLLTFYF